MEALEVGCAPAVPAAVVVTVIEAKAVELAEAAPVFGRPFAALALGAAAGPAEGGFAAPAEVAAALFTVPADALAEMTVVLSAADDGFELAAVFVAVFFVEAPALLEFTVVVLLGTAATAVDVPGVLLLVVADVF